jgi:carbamoyl-phosphate synthase large subunit
MSYTIGITGTGSLIGQAIIKSINKSANKADYKLIGFDYFVNTVGSFWCDENFLLPDLLKPGNEDEWINKIVNVIETKNIRILFVGVDFELPIFAKHKNQIESVTNCKIIVSSENVINIGNDKYLTYLFLKENGLSHPLTYLPEECDFSSLTFPMIVKPRVGARSIGVYKVNSVTDLESAIAKVRDPVIQELIGNDATEYTCGIISLNGTLQRSIALKRSLKEGNTFISEYKVDFPAVIYDYLEDIAKKLQPFGACNLQLRLDSDGIPKLFEINPRHSGTTFMRSLFGFKEVEFIIDYLLNCVEQQFDMREGTVVRYYDEFYMPLK